jgi:LAO/AO transport system kinase
MEAADLVLVNKADGDLLNAAKHTKADYAGSMQFIRRKQIDWDPKVLMMSAHTGFNMDKVEEQLFGFHNLMIQNGHLHRKRLQQAKHWSAGQFRKMVFDEFEGHSRWGGYVEEVNRGLEAGFLTPRSAAAALMQKVKISVK